ncbi:MAG: hypothetical protein ABIP69_03660 [Ferruginibacter sp.]
MLINIIIPNSKLMLRFYSKFVIICNIAFIISVIIRFIETGKPGVASNKIIKFEPIENSIIILGYSAVIFNLIFILIISGLLMFSKQYNISRKTVIFCATMLVLQLFYFFF